MLAVTDLKKRYAGPQGEVRALDGLSLVIEPGEFVAVQGPSGCGKTTLLLAAGGLLEPDSGVVTVNGRNLYGMSPNARARFRARTIGFVFQQYHLIPYLTVLDNVLAASLAARSAEARQSATNLVARFGLTDRRSHVPAELSAGERQRTALARALLNKPGLILADELTGNLDRVNADAVLGHLTDFAAAGGAVLLVTHNEHAASYAHRSIYLERGRLAAA